MELLDILCLCALAFIAAFIFALIVEIPIVWQFKVSLALIMNVVIIAVYTITLNRKD
jgi:hypothetical protein